MASVGVRVARPSAVSQPRLKSVSRISARWRRWMWTNWYLELHRESRQGGSFPTRCWWFPFPSQTGTSIWSPKTHVHVVQLDGFTTLVCGKALEVRAVLPTAATAVAVNTERCGVSFAPVSSDGAPCGGVSFVGALRRGSGWNKANTANNQKSGVYWWYSRGNSIFGGSPGKNGPLSR